MDPAEVNVRLSSSAQVNCDVVADEIVVSQSPAIATFEFIKIIKIKKSLISMKFFNFI